MKLHSLNICGFRGFQEEFKIEFASGFTVITGRNGVGKSTICDAIEFALTGNIDKYKVEKSAKESLEDYLWWRGEGKAKSYFVKLQFIDEKGNIFSVKRDRVEGLNVDVSDIEDHLCESESKPSEAIQRLCRTSIIRDEWIAAYSLDLNETSRFNLVRTSLGAIDGSDYLSRSENVFKACEKELKKAEDSYEEFRLELNESLTKLTKLRDSALDTDDIKLVLDSLKNDFSDLPGDIKQAIAFIREIIKKRRELLSGFQELLDEAVRIQSLRSSFESQKEKSSEVKHTIEAFKSEQKNIDERLLKASENLELERQADDMAAALSSLIQHGEHLGLDNGSCPLCQAERTNKEFSLGLAAARNRLRKLGGNVESAEITVDELKTEWLNISDKIMHLEAEIEKVSGLERTLRDRQERHIELAQQIGAENSIFSVLNEPDKLEQVYLRERSELIDLEQSLITLESSRVLDQITDLEGNIDKIRKEVDKSSKYLRKCQKALEVARNIRHEVKRTSHEIVDERLSMISPLLCELYQRLRPHSNWRNIQYHIRGDVRRFLSLMVGDDLNPQFVFSSGQRRAAGLAFLLTVYLSRLWSKWRTIILDDPVQHIDDFRALHLVEVLSTLRQSDIQIICAVEDNALANLLCRRLNNNEPNLGYIYDLDFTISGGIDVIRNKNIAPLPQNLLKGISYS